MPMYDRCCSSCEWQSIDALRPVGFAWPPCPECGAVTKPLWTATANVIQDEIPGGMWIDNLGPKPVKVYAKSERKRLMNLVNVEEFVRHQPEQGSDKSKHTTSWASGPPVEEYEKIALMLKRVDETGTR